MATLLDPATSFRETPKLGRTADHALRTLSVLIPIYNERFTLRRLIQRVLAAEVPLDVEIVAVDDCSTDGSWEILQELAQQTDRLAAVRHEKNQGKGGAIRTAIRHMTGDVAVIQDADLEYDPAEYARLLAPVLAGQADAVFGSRFRGESRRVLFFWHSVANGLLTLLSNMINDLNLTDMETCYKVIRADTLRALRLQCNSFTLEPELTSRLAQWGGPIYEVPISYSGRTYAEGKKIGPLDAVRAVWEIFRSGVFDRRFTDHSGLYILSAVAKADKYNRWVLNKARPYMGERLLEAGAGIGNLSNLLLDRDRLVLADYEPLYVARLRQRFGHLDHVRVEQADLTTPEILPLLAEEKLDTIFSSNVLEHIHDDQSVLDRFNDLLAPGGHCVIVVPAGPRLYTQVDAELGHYRRYTPEEMSRKMEAAGFTVVHSERFNRLGALSWFVSGNFLGRRDLSPGQMIWFDRLLGLAKLLEHVLPVPGMSLLTVGRKDDGPRYGETRS
jgi:glycosyltransferase involved in cell wall biosynthesis